MIRYIQGNIFNCDADALVNPVNCVGVMSRGVAYQCKRMFPDNFSAYRIACMRKEIQLGQMFVHKLYRNTRPYYIINFPTKGHWHNKSRLEDIETGLYALVKTIYQYDIRFIAIPALGCGLGGLHWNRVRILIDAILADLQNVLIYVYEPSLT